MAQQTCLTYGRAGSSREVFFVNTLLQCLLCVGGLLAWLGPGAAASTAQNNVDYLTAIGIHPWNTSMSIVSHGNINLVNGNLHLEIPVGSFPQRGERNLTISLLYDNRIWHVPVWPWIWSPDNVPGSDLGGWRLGTNGGANITSYQTSPTECSQYPPGYVPYYTLYNNFSWTAADGTTYTFGAAQTMNVPDPNCWDYPDTPNSESLADDRSGYHLYVTNYTSMTVVAPDGTVVYSPSPGSKDPNGNSASCSTASCQDTLGRAAFTYVPSGASCPTSFCYQVLNSQGSTSLFKVTTQTINVSTNFGVSGVSEKSGTITVIQRIDLPDGTNYQFTYDSGTTPGHYGLVTGMTLPSGGQVNFGYTNFTDSANETNRWVTSYTSGGGTWNFAPLVLAGPPCTCQQQLTVTKPSGDFTVAKFAVTLGSGAFPTLIQYYSAASPSTPMATTSMSWDYSAARKLTETNTLQLPTGTSINNTFRYTYDSATPYISNVAKIEAWKFYIGSLPPTPDLVTSTTFTTANTNYLNKNIVSLPTSITVKTGGGTQLARTNFIYDSTSLTPINGVIQHDDTNFGMSNTIRGNQTQVQRWVTGSTYLTTTNYYDTTGQKVQTQDPASNTTNFGYADCFRTDNGANPPTTYTPATPTNAYLTRATLPRSGSLNYCYYFNTGKLAFSQDQNALTTYNHYLDPWDRPTHTYFPDGGWNLTQYTSATQIDSYTALTSTTPSTSCTGCRHDRTILDSLGRTAHTVLVSDPEGADFTDTAYDSNGRIYSVSNPHRSVSLSTDGSQISTYDGLDRQMQITRPDGSLTHTYFGSQVGTNGGASSQLCSSGTYGLGYPILYVDEAGKKRQTWTDGFGKLIEVDEPDSGGSLTVPTCYQYNGLGNLTQVVQGTRTRSFTYDPLSRLTSSTNPESGTITYTYDPNSNVKTKVAPAPNQTGTLTVTTTYSYDPLNRVTQKSYSDGATPTVGYGYDAIAPAGCTLPTLVIHNGLGKRTGMCDAAGAEAWSWDITPNVGWKLTDARTTNNVTTNTIVQNNLAGLAATLTYPSGRTITYTPSGAARIVSAVDSTGPINYATGALYSPAGALSSLTNNTSIVSTFFYNNRLQPCRISVKNTGTAPTSCTDAATGNVLDLSYNFSLGSSDNGNVIAITNNRDTTRSQSFAYDSLNRISTAKTTSTSGTTCWDEAFGYDPWGNLLSIGRINGYTCSNEELLNVSATIKNQINGDTYDAAGNLINDGLGHAYTYNAENQLLTAAGVTYTYDGDGKRVQKSSGKLYWYGMGSDPLDETDLTGSTSNASFNEYIFFGGKRIARRDSTNAAHYYFSDHLGSAKMVTDALGTMSACPTNPSLITGEDESDFYPFGGERQLCNRVSQNYKFTGKERDSESGLDNFGARYDASSLGRFMTPDWSTSPVAVPYSDLNDPQSLNLYSYARNRPLVSIDRDGHCVFGLDTIVCYAAAAGAAALIIESISSHFRELKAKADNAAAAVALDRVCSYSPTCNGKKVHEQTVSAIKEAGASADETGISVTPQTPVPTSGEELIIDAATHAVKEAALEAEKKKIEEEKRQREEEAKKKQKDQRNQRCQGGDGTGECAIEDP